MLTAIGDVMRKAYDRGWLSTRDGNISVKMGKYFYITPSAVRKNVIQPEHIVKILIPKSGKLEDTTHFTKSPASIEIDLHWRLQQVKRVKAVVHLHPTYTIAAMFAGWDLASLARHFPELGRYTKVGPTVPCLKPGSSDLAAFTYLHLLEQPYAPYKSDIVGLDRHGVVAIGEHPWDAFEHIERLEHICQIVLVSGVRPENGKNQEE